MHGIALLGESPEAYAESSHLPIEDGRPYPCR
jgi:hypothetical protein